MRFWSLFHFFLKLCIAQKLFSQQDVKSHLVAALEEAGCGHWIGKPVEQDQFSM